MGDPRNTEIFLREAGGNDVQSCVIVAAEQPTRGGCLNTMRPGMTWDLEAQKDL